MTMHRMLGFDYDPDALGFDLFHDGPGDLIREAFLNLEPAREDVHNARSFAETDHLIGENVRDVTAAKEGQGMMLAKAKHLDVLGDART